MSLYLLESKSGSAWQEPLGIVTKFQNEKLARLTMKMAIRKNPIRSYRVVHLLYLDEMSASLEAAPGALAGNAGSSPSLSALQPVTAHAADGEGMK